MSTNNTVVPNSFSYNMVKAWNVLPNDIKNITGHEQFKLRLKRYLINQWCLILLFIIKLITCVQVYGQSFQQAQRYIADEGTSQWSPLIDLKSMENESFYNASVFLLILYVYKYIYHLIDTFLSPQNTHNMVLFKVI